MARPRTVSTPRFARRRETAHRGVGTGVFVLHVLVQRV